MNRQDGMPSRLRGDYAAFFHQDLGREQPALAVLVVDQRQPALVSRRSLFAPACLVGIENLPAEDGSGTQTARLWTYFSYLPNVPGAREARIAEARSYAE